MTRDEILTMPAGREMDALIGDFVLVLTVDPTRCPYCAGDLWQGKDRSRCTNCSRWLYSPYKQYSDEIESAWEVVEKMKFISLNRHAVYWICHFDDGQYEDIAQGETAPLAICRAALLTKVG